MALPETDRRCWLSSCVIVIRMVLSSFAMDSVSFSVGTLGLIVPVD